MKKYLRITLCAVLLFTIMGCGENKKESSNVNNSEIETKDTVKNKENEENNNSESMEVNNENSTPGDIDSEPKENTNNTEIKNENNIPNSTNNTTPTNTELIDVPKAEEEKSMLLDCSYSDKDDYMMIKSLFSYDKDGKMIKAVNYSIELNFGAELLKDITEEDKASFCAEFADDAIKSCSGNIVGDKYIVSI